MNFAKVGKRRVDIENFLTIILMSIIAGIGTYTMFGAITGIRVMEFDGLTVVGCISGLSGIYFGILSFLGEFVMVSYNM